jgi:poly(3-hydroxyalkanoate) synthetase
VRWLSERSGGHSEAPQVLGSASFPPIEAAPGSYILL